MADNNTNTALVAIISAGSVVVSQIATLLLTNIKEKRQQKFELFKGSFQKKIEVGEKYFIITSESLYLLNASIYHIRQKNLKSRQNIDWLDKSIEMLTDSYHKNPIDKNQTTATTNIYFKIKTTPKSISKDDIKTTQLRLEISELVNEYKLNSDENKTEQLKKIRVAEEALCIHFEKMIGLMQEDLNIIQHEISTITNKLK